MPLITLFDKPREHRKHGVIVVQPFDDKGVVEKVRHTFGRNERKQRQQDTKDRKRLESTCQQAAQHVDFFDEYRIFRNVVQNAAKKQH